MHTCLLAHKDTHAFQRQSISISLKTIDNPTLEWPV
uniref:Uncharacterized protein n=1 Tax=Rhizophora mucronata TaxID=61149 RepID=A0A2P2QVI8_RHIMU